MIVTGAAGFLGGELVAQTRRLCPSSRITVLASPRRGGIDLAEPDSASRLATDVPIDDRAATVLIHAAAAIQETSDPGANEKMAVQVARWAQSARIGFCVMVSSVSVYTPLLAHTPVDASTQPVSAYGLDKLNAERVWQRTLPEEKRAIVRLAGLWGWQRHPTLFWNRLLLAAGRGSPPEPVPLVLRKQSWRNYISVSEAGECLVRLAMNRIAGTFLAAGQSSMTTESFALALQKLPGSRLTVDWRDDGGSDECLYSFSPEIAVWLQPFEANLSAAWAAKPEWLSQ